jgi:hypothetical protein
MKGEASLKDALQSLVERWQYSDGKGFRGFYEEAQELLAAHPVEPAAEPDHEPGTAFLVIEVPPEGAAFADEFGLKVFEYAHSLEQDYRGRSWDLFMYRQHSAPPADVPAASPAEVDPETGCAACISGDTENCTCFAETGFARPLLDREAVENAIAEASNPDEADLILGRKYVGGWADAFADAVMKLARPMPTREQIAISTHERTEVHGWLSGDCSGSCQDHHLGNADAVLALLNGTES